MVLREFHLTEVDGYFSPNEDDDDNNNDDANEFNVMFFILGFISQIDMGFHTWERGHGSSFTEALDNVYTKIYNRFKNKHDLYVDTMKMESYTELAKDDKSKRMGNAFFPLQDDVDTFEALMKERPTKTP